MGKTGAEKRRVDDEQRAVALFPLKGQRAAAVRSEQRRARLLDCDSFTSKCD